MTFEAATTEASRAAVSEGPLSSLSGRRKDSGRGGEGGDVPEKGHEGDPKGFEVRILVEPVEAASELDVAELDDADDGDSPCSQ